MPEENESEAESMTLKEMQEEYELYCGTRDWNIKRRVMKDEGDEVIAVFK